MVFQNYRGRTSDSVLEDYDFMTFEGGCKMKRIKRRCYRWICMGLLLFAFSSGERTDVYAEPQNAEETASKMFFGNSADNSVGRARNNFENGNWSAMSSEEQQAVQAAIENFKAAYIKDGMSDFEKEMQIIQWIVANCEYRTDLENGSATAYGCIVNGYAQCAGYADAFLHTARACGLEVRYVANSSHAWNLIQLDGEWYHVDVTWEDPTGQNEYGFGNLRCMYVNLSDKEIKGIPSHHTWSPNTIKAEGMKYGSRTAMYYMWTGEILYNEEGLDPVYAVDNERNLAIRKILEEYDGTVFRFTTTEETLYCIDEYLGSLSDIADMDFLVEWEVFDLYIKNTSDFHKGLQELYKKHGYYQYTGIPGEIPGDNEVITYSTSLSGEPFRETAPERIVYYAVRMSERFDKVSPYANIPQVEDYS